MERTNHTSVNYIRIVKQKLHGPNEKGNQHLKKIFVKLYNVLSILNETISDLLKLHHLK